MVLFYLDFRKIPRPVKSDNFRPLIRGNRENILYFYRFAQSITSFKIDKGDFVWCGLRENISIIVAAAEFLSDLSRFCFHGDTPYHTLLRLSREKFNFLKKRKNARGKRGKNKKTN